VVRENAGHANWGWDKSAQLELSGALLNPRLQVELPGLVRLREQLAGRNTAERPARRALRRRQGSVLVAVTTVLERAGRPLRVLGRPRRR